MDAQVCDHRSVGVILEREDRVLLLTRTAFPPAIAPVDGHVDAHGDPHSAAVAAVREQTGLQLTNPQMVIDSWRPNVCRRPLVAHRDPGHQWSVYRAQAHGPLAPDLRGQARWMDGDELRRLADRTVGYAHGVITDAAWRGRPGIEPVWVAWLSVAGLVAGIAPRDLTLVDAVASRPLGGWR
jgi:ADP-ribose pyrophosphatase YjhB (NUDIX family)